MFPIGPLAIPLITAGLQTGMGLLQRGAASRRRKSATEDMKYDIPSATKEQLQMARERASRNGLPGEDITRSRMESDISGAVAKGESVAETSSDVLGLYQKMAGNKMDMNRKILEAGTQYKSENELQLMKSMGMMAEAEKDQFYHNRFVPFLSEMGYAGEQAAGGSANIAGGLQTAYQGFMNNFMTQQFKDGQDAEAPGITDTNRIKLNNIAEYGKSQTPEVQTGFNTSKSEFSPWTDPRDPYNVGHPNRDQLPQYGQNNNNYGNNYPAY